MHPITYSLIINIVAIVAILTAAITLDAGPVETGLLLVVMVLIQTHAMQRFETARHEAEDDSEEGQPIGFLTDLDAR